ncbi:MAG: selenium metabolism-associated LysR family transcriptional regulator [Candidatus Bathyarchaeota archaeon]|nr:selenium metabolism-associated LysR family transcriptional regulator [Candidatus Termiticorpusculum sp.]
MDFKQIEAFIKVIELASFSKAADTLNVSQPSISTYITSLEKELNTTLINRSTKVLSTTLAGERFYEKANELLNLKRETIEMLQNLSEDISGNINILASSVPALYILPQILADFHKLYPRISFTMNQADTSKVIQGIAINKADIGFAGDIIEDKKCDFHEFINEKLVFIAPNNNTYLQNKKYTIAELLYSNKFISREIGSGTRMQYEKYFIENGIQLDKIKTCANLDSTHSIINAVINELGISIISELAAHDAFKQKLLIPIRLKNEPPQRKIYTVLNKNINHSHIIKLFMEYITNIKSQITHN